MKYTVKTLSQEIIKVVCCTANKDAWGKKLNLNKSMITLLDILKSKRKNYSLSNFSLILYYIFFSGVVETVFLLWYNINNIQLTI